MQNNRFNVALSLLLIAMSSFLHAQTITSRPNPADPAFPFNTPAPVSHPVSTAQLKQWRSQIKSALFISDPLPALNPKTYGTFSPTPDVTAERVSYGTEFGMRIPAIVYSPAHSTGKLPAIVVVNGHGGDKTTWYSYYTGILYAHAGAVVVTYDPIGADERNSQRASETRTHDTPIDGPHTPARMGGLMITDIMQAVSYLLQRPDVDPARIAVVGYSMGSFLSTIDGAVDPRFHALLLSAGGDLDGNGGSWDHSAKIMCQAGPYHALSFLPDKSTIIYALNQQRGPTLVLNGSIDPLVGAPHHFEPFYEDLRVRTAALTGSHTNLIESYFYPNVGHRPSWMTRRGALWLNKQLHFPNWTDEKINALPEIKVSEWAARTGAHINKGFEPEEREGGILALNVDVPFLTREQLQAIPDATWQQEKDNFVWESWVHHALTADGVPASEQKIPAELK